MSGDPRPGGEGFAGPHALVEIPQRLDRNLAAGSSNLVFGLQTVDAGQMPIDRVALRQLQAPTRSSGIFPKGVSAFHFGHSLAVT